MYRLERWDVKSNVQFGYAKLTFMFGCGPGNWNM